MDVHRAAATGLRQNTQTNAPPADNPVTVDSEGPLYFEFEQLDVYQAALEFISRVDQIVHQLPQGYGHRKNQLQRSADSIADNIAEGVGEFAANERRRFLRISRRSALEAASQLLVIKQQQQAEAKLVGQTLALLHRIVCMLTKMASGTKERRTA